MNKEIQNNKELIWRRKLEELEEIGDSLNKGIDEGIKETVAVFNLMGLNTYASCEGHLNWGMGAPWVGVQAEDEPDERFMGEKKNIEKIAKKYGITYEDVKQANNKEAWVEAVKTSSESEEMPEYKDWRKENEKLWEKAQEFLDEFYKDRNAPADSRLVIEGIGGGGAFRLHNGGKDYEVMPKDMAEEQKSGLQERLPRHQAEMLAFGEFLKNKFFNS